MNRAFVLSLAFIGTFAVREASYAGEPLADQANAWTKGKPIPAELFTYRRSGSGVDYSPSRTDTSTIIGGITNANLLLEMLFNPKIDDRVFSQAVTRGIHLAGPKWFLNEAYRRYQQHAEALLFPMHKRLFIELNQRHALVDAIFINEADMPATNAVETIQRMVNEMQTGKSWDNVINEYSANLRTQLDIGGLPGGVSMSKISRFGPFVLCEQTKASQTFVSDPLPREQRSALLERNEGEVMMIHDPAYRRVLLYRVREVYIPKPD